ncbi:hypothetical protein ACHMW6_21210 [Pseudoduganella sp. UC29_106]|uniref:hypothetical protein n=1 Tax=Pseudoduganella sp. UC29_106 TaxID=3374553 RepID=UPI0037581F2E
MLATDKPSYRAFEPVTVQMEVSNSAAQPVQDAVVDVTIFGPDGQVVSTQQAIRIDADGVAQNLFTFPAGGSTAIAVKWSTQSYAPGQYLVKVRTMTENVASGSRSILSERTAAFTIEPTTRVLRLGVTPLPAYSNLGASEQLRFRVEATQQSNLPASTSFRLALKAPDGSLIREETGAVSMLAHEVLGSVELGPFTQQFNASGIYRLELSPAGGAEAETLAGSQIEVAPGIRVEASQQVTPNTVTPDGDKRIRIQLQLKGVEQK